MYVYYWICWWISRRNLVVTCCNQGLKLFMIPGMSHSVGSCRKLGGQTRYHWHWVHGQIFNEFICTRIFFCSSVQCRCYAFFPVVYRGQLQTLNGGLEHVLFSHILGIITPFDSYFFRWVGQPPSRTCCFMGFLSKNPPPFGMI